MYSQDREKDKTTLEKLTKTNSLSVSVIEPPISRDQNKNDAEPEAEEDARPNLKDFRKPVKPQSPEEKMKLLEARMAAPTSDNKVGLLEINGEDDL